MKEIPNSYISNCFNKVGITFYSLFFAKSNFHRLTKTILHFGSKKIEEVRTSY